MITVTSVTPIPHSLGSKDLTQISPGTTGDAQAGELPGAGLGPFVDSWVFTLVPGDPNDFEAHHTGGDVMVWSQGPGSEALERAIDNTFVYQVVKKALKSEEAPRNINLGPTTHAVGPSYEQREA